MILYLKNITKCLSFLCKMKVYIFIAYKYVDFYACASSFLYTYHIHVQY